MTAVERRAAGSLATIFSMRMLGLFMVLPVLSLYVQGLPGGTPVLAGTAVGIYGLTQALLQIPFGMLSDKLGRKPIITFGLLIFAAGSVLAAMSHSVYGVILGRALQGAGAVAAAVMALAADLTREEHRTKAMAMIGMSIGTSFVVAMVAGPLLNNWIGVSGIFWVIGALALLGIVLLFAMVPHPRQMRFHRDTELVPGQFGNVIRNSELLRLDFGILVLHMTLTATFTVIPQALRDVAHFDPSHHWILYLPVMTLAMIASVPFIIIAEKRRRMKEVVLGAIAVLGLAELGMMEFHSSVVIIGIVMWVYFTAFTLLEATMPSMLSKIAPADAKGTGMGVYSTSQFLGAFVGGVAGGWVYSHHSFAGAFGFCAALIAVWLAWASTMKQPPYLQTSLLNVGTIDPEQATQLAAQIAKVPGVAEVVVKSEDGVAYLKVDSKVLDEAQLNRFSVGVSNEAPAQA